MSRTSKLWPIVAVAMVVLGASAAVVTGRLDGTATAAVTAATPSSGCGKAPTLTNGLRTMSSSGKTREYTLRIPENYDSSRPYRLIFAFHWRGGTMKDIDDPGGSGQPWAYYGLKALSDNSAIFVAPQGLNAGWANSGGEDLVFVDNMVKEFKSGLCVDETQVFAMGFSFGGGMSFALACARPTVFRAVAVYGGGQISGCEGGSQPVAYIGIHGIRDGILPIARGRELRDRFVRNNGCTPQNPPEPARDSLTHIVTYYSGCKPGYPVAWAPFDGGHAPNAVDGTAWEFAPGENSWTRPVVWDFFTKVAALPETTPPPVTPTTSAPPNSPPPSSPAPSTPAPSTPAPPTDEANPHTCAATYKTVSSWPGGFQGEVTVTRRASSAPPGWTVRLALGPGQTIGNLWNGVSTGTGNTVTVTNAAYNALSGTGTSTTFGFVASGSSTAAPTLQGCRHP